MKVIAGRSLFFWIICLREAGLAQAAITFEDLSALATDRLRADGGKLIATVRFIEGTVRNSAPAQVVKALE